MSIQYALWIPASLSTCAMQLALGTDPAFAVFSLAIFLMLPLGYRLFQQADSIGGFLFLATFAKLFILSQWVKIALLQPADSHLDAPVETVMALAFAMLGMVAAAAALRKVLPSVSVLLRPSHDPRGMYRVAVGALVLGLLGVLVRYAYGVDRVALSDEAEDMLRGKGVVLWIFLSTLLPLVPAVFTARCMVLSNRRAWFDVHVAASLLLCVIVGLWFNSRTSMVAGPVSCYFAYLSYGGRIKRSHVVAAVIATLLMQMVIFPFVDIQRSLPVGVSVSEYISLSAEIAAQIVIGGNTQTYTGINLSEVYEAWVTRQYYGMPTGFLDRFTPSQVDEVVAHLVTDEPLGADYLLRPLWHAIPLAVLNRFDLDWPVTGGELLHQIVWNNELYSFANYGIVPELYAYVGLTGMTVASAVCVFLFVLILHVFYGGFRNNYFAAFGAQIFLLAMADGDLSVMVGQTLHQGILFALLFTAARIAWPGQFGRLSRPGLA